MQVHKKIEGGHFFIEKVHDLVGKMLARDLQAGCATYTRRHLNREHTAATHTPPRAPEE